MTKELQRLMELRVYPFDELSAIRFEFEVLDKRRKAVIDRHVLMNELNVDIHCCHKSHDQTVLSQLSLHTELQHTPTFCYVIVRC